MKKATPDELAAAALLNKALEEEENAALQDVPSNTDVPTPTADIAGNTPNADAPNFTAPKRKRGRPSDAERAIREAVGSTTNANSDTGAGLKRGPKPKGKGSDTGTLAKSLVGIHQLISLVTGFQQIQLSPEEGQALAEAFCAVSEEYGFAVSGKTGAAVQLLGAVAMIYGPRIFFIKVQIEQQKALADKGAHNGPTTSAGN